MTGKVEDWKVLTEYGDYASETGTDVQGLQGNLKGNYVLGQGIYTHSWPWGSPFRPIGKSYENPFKGKFDGLGHFISYLSFKKMYAGGSGLFGYTNEATIRNFALTVFFIDGVDNVGALVGHASKTIIKNCYAQGRLTGNDNVGGLVGFNEDSIIENSYAKVKTKGHYNIGGLVGFNKNSTIKNSYSKATVEGKVNTGGLVGISEYSTVENSFWDKDVSKYSSSAGGIGLLSTQMRDSAAFYNAGWDFDRIWGRDTKNEYLPYRYMELKLFNSKFSYNTVMSVNLNTYTKTYNKSDDISSVFFKIKYYK